MSVAGRCLSLEMQGDDRTKPARKIHISKNNKNGEAFIYKGFQDCNALKTGVTA